MTVVNGEIVYKKGKINENAKKGKAIEFLKSMKCLKYFIEQIFIKKKGKYKL